MKEKLRIIWHKLRAGFHWNRMIAKQDRTGFLHSTLMERDASYRESSYRYDDSISVLVGAGSYVTARSLILKKVKD